MDTSDWIALGALVVAAGGFGVSLWALMYARRSAQAARDSADEARQLREIEADRRTEEKEKRHEELSPDLPAEIRTELEGARAAGHVSLFGSIRVDRAYRVRAYGRVEDSLVPLSLPSVLPGHGEPVRFAIEHWSDGQDEPRTAEILFKFWPPVEGVDRGELWSCGCGRPGGETLEGTGHWERRVRVNYRSPFAV